LKATPFTILLVSAVLGLGILPTCCGKVDPEAGRIRLLVVGEQNGGNVYVMSIIRSDPRIFHYATILAGAGAMPDEARREARIYTPRTKDRFISSIDVIEFLDCPPWAFTDAQQEWIRDGVFTDGLGLVLVEMGWHSCNYAWWHCNRPDVWINSPIYDAWSVNVVLEKTVRPSPYAEIVQHSPIVDLPNFEKQPYGGPAHNTGLVVARPGSMVHARWRTGKEDAIVSNEYGKGRTLNLPTGWDCVSGQMMRNWKYFVDFVLNGIYFAAGAPMPDDPELAHSLRAAFTQFYEQKVLMLSVIDFIDKFGANTVALYRELDDLEGQSKDAAALYMKGDFQASWNAVHRALNGLTNLSEEATKLRKKAMLWIYLTEWLTVTGTSMACGFLLWTLMVKRRYYRELVTTRLNPSKE